MLNTRMPDTASTSAKADDEGGRYQHIELDEVNLISRPATAVTVEGGRLLQQYPARSTGDIEVTREVKVSSDAMV